jgi:DNA-directed RNA polymerase beta subunit
MSNSNEIIDPALETNDMMVLVMAEIQRKKIAGHHINSFNSLCKKGIPQIVKDLFEVNINQLKNERNKTDEDKLIDHFSIKVIFTDSRVETPTFFNETNTKNQALWPALARLKGLTYSGSIYISAKVTAIATLKDGSTREREAEVKDIYIGAIPIMIGSEKCYTYNQDRAALKNMHEDPQDNGGYFIIRGGEWSIDSQENLVINSFHVYRNMHANEVARGTFQSKPGDAFENSYYMVIRYLQNGALTAQITLNKEQSFEVPFFLLFRAFGMNRDDEILNHIVYGLDNKDPVTLHMLNVLTRAMKTTVGGTNDRFADLVNPTTVEAAVASVNSAAILERFSNIIYEYTISGAYKKDENAIKYIVNNTQNQIDRIFFPHIGTGPATRLKKLRFFGHLINKLLRVELGVLEGTDRDSFKNKRVQAAGVSLAKAFKANFNTIVVRDIKKNLQRDFRGNSFSSIQLAECIRSAVMPRDLEKVMTQSITSGNKTITVRRNETTNRISSQQLYRKNDLHVKSVANTISTTNSSAAKKTERAEEMRKVHPTYIGYIAITQSADTGEKVGMSKQLACMASICEASSSEILKNHLLSDEEVIPLDNLIDPSLVTSKKLTKIFVNGDWVGFCEEGYKLAAKYRTLRRTGRIHQFTTIVWELLVREIHFWVDVGRLIRPLVIVYNNLNEILAAAAKKRDRNKSAAERDKISIPPFRQWIKLTKNHINLLISGRITIDNLREDGILEYITPEELEGLYLAESLKILKEAAGNITKQYTHCDIEQAIFGIIELSSPNTNHTPATRICMSTNQKKQSNSWFALNWPYRIDKNSFLQYYCDTPIVKVFSDAIVYPSGQNVMIAYQVAAWNQEDSAIVKKSAIDRGLFAGSKFYFEKTELEKDESFGNPDLTKTINIKAEANYACTEKGFVKEGTIVNKGDVLIIKHAKLPKAEKGKLYDDRSIVYKFAEPAIVEKVVVTLNDEKKSMARVKLRMIRPLQVGDKISSRSGNKSIVALIVPDADMPYTEDGQIPDIIINSHALPTRMTVGQFIETLQGAYCSMKGGLLDATPFAEKDINAMIDEAEKKYGITNAGHQRMYNGRTGIWMDAFIFCGIVSYQRLQKFALDQSYAMETGPTCVLTRQPMDGKAKGGGMRIGGISPKVAINFLFILSKKGNARLVIMCFFFY